MEDRIKVDMELLVYNDYHFEKAKVVKREKGLYILNNQMRITRDGVPINSKLKVKPFDILEFEYLVAKRDLPKLIKSLEVSSKGLPSEATIKLYDKVKKLVTKYV